MNFSNLLKTLIFIVYLSVAANAATIVSIMDRMTFDSIGGETILEDFTSGYKGVIPNGVLNSESSFGNLVAGDIRPGASYSTPLGPTYPSPLGPCCYFNLSAGVDYDGGFLDSLAESGERDLTITYDNPVSFFGFDAYRFVPNINLTIHFSDGSMDYNETFTGFTQTQFLGFTSTSRNISSVVIDGFGDDRFNFLIDNHIFDASAVPEPSSSMYFAGISVILLFRRARSISLAAVRESDSC